MKENLQAGLIFLGTFIALFVLPVSCGMYFADKTTPDPNLAKENFRNFCQETEQCATFYCESRGNGGWYQVCTITDRNGNFHKVYCGHGHCSVYDLDRD